jgi:hypothetical protein
LIWQNILDSERDDGEPGGESFRDFPLNMFGIIRMLREDQDEHPAGFKTLHDSFGPSGTRFDITGSDPTASSAYHAAWYVIEILDWRFRITRMRIREKGPLWIYFTVSLPVWFWPVFWRLRPPPHSLTAEEAAAISLGLPGVALVAVALRNTKERFEHGDPFEHGDRFRHDRDFFFGGPFLYDYPYYGYDYPYYRYNAYYGFRR